MGFTPLAIQLAQDVRFRGSLPYANRYGAGGLVGEGPYFELYCELNEGVIQRAAFRTHGCMTSIAVGSALCYMMQGKTEAVAKSIDHHDLMALVGEVPEGKEFCFDLAVRARDEALMEIGDKEANGK